MILKTLSLQNFRSYTKSQFTFSPQITYIVGQNNSGKTNLIEALYLLSTGKSFRAGKDTEMISYDAEMARVKGVVLNDSPDTQLEVILTVGMISQIKTQMKKYLVNSISRRQMDFASHLVVVLFKPDDLDIVVGSPGGRRNFLDSVLEQVSLDYRHGVIAYTKALRQRNALLDRMRDMGIIHDKQLDYWNDILITSGKVITKHREELVDYFNTQKKDIFDCTIEYDKSVISEQRLLQYQRQEIAAANTLVGPHRDDLFIKMGNGGDHEVRYFGSRGQQRLAIIQLKMLQVSYIEKHLKVRPLLLLDDFFSELDSKNIDIVLSMIDKQQTVLTTTHQEFIPKKLARSAQIIDLSI